MSISLEDPDRPGGTDLKLPEPVNDLLASFERAEQGEFTYGGATLYWGKKYDGTFSYSILQPERDLVNVNDVPYEALPDVVRRNIELSRQVEYSKDSKPVKKVLKAVKTVDRIDPELNDRISELLYKYRHFVKHGTTKLAGKIWQWVLEYNEILHTVTIDYQEGQRGEWIDDLYAESVPVELLSAILARLATRLDRLGMVNNEAQEIADAALENQAQQERDNIRFNVLPRSCF